MLWFLVLISLLTAGCTSFYELMGYNLSGSISPDSSSSGSSQAASDAPVFPLPYGPYITRSGSNTYRILTYTTNKTQDSITVNQGGADTVLTDPQPAYSHSYEFSVTNTFFTYLVSSSETYLNGIKGIVSNPLTASFRFCFYGDTRFPEASSNEYHLGAATNEALTRTMALYNPAFIINAGDVVNIGWNTWEWPWYFRSGAALLSNAVLFQVKGNHEMYSDSYYNSLFPYSPTAYYYKAVYPGLELFVIDTDMVNGFGFQPGTTQYRFLTNALAKSTAQWKVVAVHHPPWRTSPGHYTDISGDQVLAHLVPVFEMYGVQLVLNGHDHMYQLFQTNGVTYMTMGAGGGYLYTSFTNYSHSLTNINNVHLFALFDVAAGSMNVSIIDTNNTVRHTFSILP